MAAGFCFVAGAEEWAPVAADWVAEVAVWWPPAAGFVVAGADDAPAEPGVDDCTDSGGDCESWTSTFDDPLLQAATVNSRVSPAAIVPVVRMSVITDHARERFSFRAGSHTWS